MPMKLTRFIRQLYKQLPDLVKGDVISTETADKIRQHYGPIDKQKTAQTIVVVFSVAGAACIGFGIILLFAYNWDMLSRSVKTVLSFLPMVLSWIAIAAYLYRKKDSLAQREGFATFNLLAVGSSIALISQVYHINGAIEEFILTWMLLTVPLVYILKASLPALLYISGLIFWATCSQNQGAHAVWFWPLAGVIIPYYLRTFLKEPYRSRNVWLTWGLCIAFTIAIGICLEKVLPGLWIIIYSAFFAVLYFLGAYIFNDDVSGFQRPFRTYGMSGIVVFAYLLTFQFPWEEIGWRYYRVGGKFHGLAASIDYFLLVLLSVLAIAFLVRTVKEKLFFQASFGALPIVAFLAYFLSSCGMYAVIPIWTFNVYLLFLSIICIRAGLNEQKLGVVNAGMFLLGLLIVTRFVDASMGIILRAITFIIVGICFLVANIVLSGKMKRTKEYV